MWSPRCEGALGGLGGGTRAWGGWKRWREIGGALRFNTAGINLEDGGAAAFLSSVCSCLFRTFQTLSKVGFDLHNLK